MYYQPTASPPLTFRVIRYEVLSSQPVSDHFLSYDVHSEAGISDTKIIDVFRINLPVTCILTEMRSATWTFSANTNATEDSVIGITLFCSLGNTLILKCFVSEFNGSLLICKVSVQTLLFNFKVAIPVIFLS